jgi:uncharacterized coiled-coil protein SlyX
MTEKKKQCKCSAFNSDECVCGAWDDLNPHRLKRLLEESESRLAKAEAELKGAQNTITGLRVTIAAHEKTIAELRDDNNRLWDPL